MGIAHLDDAPFHEHELGHLRSRWTMVGDAAGCERVGVRRIQVAAGGWSTPAHEHAIAVEDHEDLLLDRVAVLRRRVRVRGHLDVLERLDYWDGED
jgi:hypothetical protein